MLRAPGFSIPFLLLPVPVYLFFGVMLAAPAVAKQASIANYLFSGFSVFAIMGPALFGVGCVLAIEREAGYLKLKRALPAPGGAYLIAKMAMAMVFAALAMSTLLVPALLVGKVTLSATQLAIMTLVMTVGALPFAALGLFIGAYVSANVAPSNFRRAASRASAATALEGVTFTMERGEMRRDPRPERLGQVDAGPAAVDAAAARRRQRAGLRPRRRREPRAVRRLVNRVSVEASFFKKMSAVENLSYAARFYGMTARETRDGSRGSSSRVGFPPTGAASRWRTCPAACSRRSRWPGRC